MSSLRVGLDVLVTIAAFVGGTAGLRHASTGLFAILDRVRTVRRLGYQRTAAVPSTVAHLTLVATCGDPIPPDILPDGQTTLVGNWKWLPVGGLVSLTLHLHVTRRTVHTTTALCVV
jgi:hypothetical protein